MFLPSHRQCAFHEGETILDVALRHNMPLGHSCGGMGTCTTCRIFLISSPNPQPLRNDLEQEQASARNFAANERLACQVLAQEGMQIEIPPASC